MKIELKMRPPGSKLAWDKAADRGGAITLIDADHADETIDQVFAEARSEHVDDAQRNGTPVPEFYEHPMRHVVLSARSNAGEEFRVLATIPHNDPELEDHISAAKGDAIRQAQAEGRPRPQFERHLELEGKHIDEVA
jgi:hypothetical protein